MYINTRGWENPKQPGRKKPGSLNKHNFSYYYKRVPGLNGTTQSEHFKP